jgi:DNA-binding transcriptional LysR family regulator
MSSEAMNLTRLHHFEALYRLGSFARAADEQRLTQSALSRSIAKLEDELATRLFDRTTHVVRPTEAADRLIRQARDVIAAVTVLTDDARGVDRPLTGQVRVGSGPYPMQSLVTPAIAAFAAELPGVRVSLIGGPSDRLLEALVSRDLDLVVCDISKFNDSAHADQVVVLPLASEPLVIVCAPDHPVASGARPSTFAWAMPKPAPDSRRRMSPALRARVAAGAFPEFEMDSTAACLDLVARGVAVSALPLSVARQAAAGGRLVLRGMPPQERTNDGVHLLKGRSRGAALTRFIEGLRAEAQAVAELGRLPV